MKEGLDAVRKLQTAMLLVSAALLALALTPNLAPRYLEALKVLRSMPALERDAELRQQNTEKYRTLFAAARYAALHPHPRVTISDSLFVIHSSDEPAIRAMPDGDSLEDEIAFHTSLNERLGLVPEPEAIKQSVARDFPATRERQGEILWYTFDIKGASVRWSFSDGPVEYRATPADLRQSAMLNVEMLDSVFRTQMSEKLDDGNYAELTEERRKQLQNIVSFPSLYEDLWEDIRGLTRPEAIRRLEERVESDSQSMSLLGLNVDERLATIGGPIVLWLSLLLSLLHLDHVRTLAARDGPDGVTDFPWPPLFRGLGGLVASLALLVYIPTFALMRLAARTAEADAARARFLYVAAATIALTGFAVHVAARRLVAGAPDRLTLRERFVSAARAAGSEWRPVAWSLRGGYETLKMASASSLVAWWWANIAALVVVVSLVVMFVRADAELTRALSRAVSAELWVMLSATVLFYLAAFGCGLGVAVVGRIAKTPVRFGDAASTAIAAMSLEPVAIGMVVLIGVFTEDLYMIKAVAAVIDLQIALVLGVRLIYLLHFSRRMFALLADAPTRRRMIVTVVATSLFGAAALLAGAFIVLLVLVAHPTSFG